MKNETNQNTVNNWLNVPVIATIARLLYRELTLQNEYLRLENKVFKSRIEKRIVFTENERRTLIEAALSMGRDLMKQVVTIVKSKTILAWQQRLENEKWDYTDRRKNNPGRPRIAKDVEQLVCRMARENN
jgi:urease accessory protein UreF